jgi:hypothetical protein
MTDPFRPDAPTAPPPRPVGQLVFGLVLVVVGVGWLVTALDLFTIPWRGLMAVVLILVGATLAATASAERHSGLVTVGVVLTLLLASISSVEGLSATPLRGGIGERTYTPATTPELTEYRLAIGQLEVDLRNLELPEGETTVVASVTIGQLIVRVPASAAVNVVGKVAAGELDIEGVMYNGVGVDETATDDGYETAPRRLRLEVAVGLGNLEVRR